MQEQTGQHQHPSHRQLLVDELALVREVHTSDVWQWLARGWEDLRAARWVTCTYAALFTVLGFVITVGFYEMELPYLILPSLSGFALIGPAGAVAFYEISRQLQLGHKPTMMTALTAWSRNTLGLMGIGVALVFLFMIWIRLAFSTYALTFPGVMPELDQMILRAISWEGITYAIISAIMGAVFAVVIFFAAAISLPMMLDRGTLLIPAMLTSTYAVWVNRKTMLVWAGVIAMFIGFGILTGFLGLILTFPVIGHASWHAYQQIVRDNP